MNLELFCQKYIINNYEIIDGVVNVDGNVFLHKKALFTIPKFGWVGGNFWISYNAIEDMDGCPYYIGGTIMCNNNIIKKLISPTFLGVSYCCGDNKLTDLVGAPLSVHVNFSTNNNKLKTLRGLEVVGEHIHIYGNPLPKEISKLYYNNIKNINILVYYQELYRIWNDDDTLNIDAFNELLFNELGPF